MFGCDAIAALQLRPFRLGSEMQKIIQFRGETSTKRGAVQVANPSQGREGMQLPLAALVLKEIDSLSRVLDRIQSLCDIIPDGSIRNQLEAERAKLVARLFEVRTTTAQLSSPETTTTGPAELKWLEAHRVNSRPTCALVM